MRGFVVLVLVGLGKVEDVVVDERLLDLGEGD